MAARRVALRPGGPDQHHAAGGAGPRGPAAPPIGSSARSLRLLGRLIDLALLGGIVALLYSDVVPRVINVAPDRRDLFDALRGGDSVLRLTMLLTGLLLEVLPVARWGWSPGKLVMGMRVRSVDGSARPGAVRSATRWLPLAAVLVLPVALPLYLVAVVPVLGRRREGWHDRLAGTWVGDAPPAG